jgi:EAL domain-containing protein (putative c-di-GMP-specific phosphodiesterase class I)
MSGVRRRTHALIALSALGLLLIVSLLALLLTHSADSFAARSAEQRARLGVDLLVSVGARLPNLSPEHVARGLSAADRHALDQAVTSGQRRRLLAGLVIWDRTGRVLYSPDERMEGTRPRLEGDLRQALAGVDVARPHPHELDPSSHRRTGVLDAFEALRDENGRVYGAIETSLPLRPILAEAQRIQRRIVVVLFAGAAVLWGLLMPFTLGAARSVAKQWVPGRRRLLRAFARGLARGEVELVYQPQVDPRTGVVDAVEALVRWRRDGSLEGPRAFLAAVEGSALIVPLTDRVFELALAQLRAWRDAGETLRMSVNLSAANLSDAALPARVGDALARHGIPGSELTVEVTETAVLEDPVGAQKVVSAIRALGVEVAVDDFGTGHASISRLHDLAIDELKVDRSFVLRTDERSRAYLAAIVRFGQSLGLRVVAEGVEDAHTLDFLRELGCDSVQGYHISRPLEADAFDQWVRERVVEAPEPSAPAPWPSSRKGASSPGSASSATPTASPSSTSVTS